MPGPTPSSPLPDMKIFARHRLFAESAGSEEELLLEGSWPSQRRRVGRWSLDEAIDARFAWIDPLATVSAQQAAQGGADCRPTLNFAYINALSLRYYFVKLFRILAFFREVRALNATESIDLHLSSWNDEPYADLFQALAVARDVKLNVHRHQSPSPSPPPLRRSLSWRRWVDRARHRRLLVDDQEVGRPCVVLCGNPRVLNPVCAELVARGARVAWLYERFAVRCWWRWRRAGVEQLVCETASASPRSFSEAGVQSEMRFDDVDLSTPVERWLSQRAAELGAQQSQLIERVAAHFRQLRPTGLVLDEDATPLKRIAAVLARQMGATSAVVQHGAPCGRFGFAPLAADQICVWGESSRKQLRAWDLPSECIRVTGWPGVKQRLLTLEPSRGRAASRAKRFLLLATVPPRDQRPDGVEFHLTSKNHAAMLSMVYRVLSQIDGATLMVKPHPRARSGDFPHDDAAPTLPVRIVRSGDLALLLAECDCVLSCASTAGIEAALAGAPVIQLLPSGSGDILPAEEWGFVGSARTELELATLATKALERGWRKDPRLVARVLADHGRQAAARIVDVVIGRSNVTCGESGTAA
jgi:hypothetical protein